MVEEHSRNKATHVSSSNKQKYYAFTSLVVLGVVVAMLAWVNRPVVKIVKAPAARDLSISAERVNATDKTMPESFRVTPGGESVVDLLAKQKKNECIWKADEMYVANRTRHGGVASVRQELEVQGAKRNQSFEGDLTLLQGRSIDVYLRMPSYFKAADRIDAIVRQEVCAEKSNIVLIPAGSVLLGTYHRILEQGQIRVYVVWTHITSRPDVTNGANYKIRSPGVKALDKAGRLGKVNAQFCKYFSHALLVSRVDGVLEKERTKIETHSLRSEACKYLGKELPDATNLYSVTNFSHKARVAVRIGRTMVFPEANVYSKVQYNGSHHD